MCDGIGSGDARIVLVTIILLLLLIYIYYTNQSGDHHNAIQYSDSKCYIYILYIW